ncbi:Rz1-like lysis system protein LysC [Enterobacter cloacae]
MTSCADKQIQYETVKAPTIPIPANLLIECPVPEVPEQMTFGDSIQMNINLLNSLDICNGQIRTIKEIEAHP